MNYLDLFATSLGIGKRVLDIGSGAGGNARTLRQLQLEVDEWDYKYNGQKLFPQDYDGGQYDGVLAAMVLEHTRNVGAFLDKVFEIVVDGGVVAIQVPPLKEPIVGGHLTLWNAPLLVYNMVLAGFDCSDAAIQHVPGRYEINLVVRKRAAELPRLVYDNGDLETLSHLFPREWDVKQNFKLTNRDNSTQWKLV